MRYAKIYSSYKCKEKKKKKENVFQESQKRIIRFIGFYPLFKIYKLIMDQKMRKKKLLENYKLTYVASLDVSKIEKYICA